MGAQYLPGQEQGKLALVFSCYFGLLIWNMASLFQWAAIRAPQVDDRPSYHTDLSRISVLFFGVSTAIILALLTAFAPLSDWEPTGHELFAIAIFIGLQQMADFDRRSAYIFLTSQRAAWSSGGVYLTRIVAIFALKPDTAMMMFYILGSTSLGPGLLTIFRTLCQTGRTVSSALAEHLKGTRWLMSASPFVWLWSYAPVFVLSALSSIELAGVFVTIRSLTNMTNVVTGTLETAFFARAGRMAIKEQDRLLRELTRIRNIGLCVWILIFTALVAFGSQLLEVTFGYSRYKELLLVLWCAQGLSFLFRLHAVAAQTLVHTAVIPATYIAATVIVSVVCYPLIAHFGLAGAATTHLMGAATLYISVLLLVKCVKGRAV